MIENLIKIKRNEVIETIELISKKIEIVKSLKKYYDLDIEKENEKDKIYRKQIMIESVQEILNDLSNSIYYVQNIEKQYIAKKIKKEVIDPAEFRLLQNIMLEITEYYEWIIEIIKLENTRDKLNKDFYK